MPHTLPAQPSGSGSPVMTVQGWLITRAISRATSPVMSPERSSTTTMEILPG